jgi:hypothetical protein
MSTSYNGWPASPDLPLRPLVVAGEEFVPGVLDNDDVHTVLQYVAQQMHERVEPVVREDWHQMDDWGFNYRQTTNDDSLSCHASGTAIDYNSTRHPYGVAASANFSPAQIATIHDIIADLPIVWGGDYRNSPDAMHFEIMGSRTAVADAAVRIRNKDKDWFDMATKDDLRAVIREEIRDTDWVKMIGTKVATSVWGRKFKTTNANGAEVSKPASEYVKETWTNLKTHLKI